MDLIEGRVPSTHFDPQKIKERLIFEAVIEEKCNKCGFAERRVIDNRVPLILHHKNKDKNEENVISLFVNGLFFLQTQSLSSHIM